MKKILALLLTLILTAGSVFAAGYYEKADVLSAIGIIDELKTDDTIVTKQEFARAAAILHGAAECAPTQTPFSDVGSDNPYSGYIAYLTERKLIESGVSFNPTDGCNAEFVYTTIAKILDFARYGNMEESYTSAAMQFSLGGEAFDDGKLTFAGMVTLFFKALEAELPGYTYTSDGSIYVNGGKNGIYLTEMLGLSVYDGTIIKTDCEEYKITAEISRNVYESNRVPLEKGESATFSAPLSIDINKFDNVPVTLWVDRNEKLLAVYPQKNVEIKYAPIYSVNNDSDKTHAYSAANIKSIMLLDDDEEYDVSRTAKTKYNGVLTTGPKKLAGKYAKIVLKDDEVIFIESWDVTPGGIITEISDDYLVYTKGTTQVKLSALNSFDRTIVIINDESRDFSELKTDTYFDYFKIKDDTLVILASERIVTSKMNGVGEGYLNIGKISYQSADKVYFSKDGTKYLLNEKDLIAASGLDVSVYINALRECVYVKLAPDAELTTGEFIGAVAGYEEDVLGGLQLAVWNMEGDAQKKIYDVSEKVKYGGTLSKATVLNSSESMDGNGIYLFTVNKKGEINSIEPPPCVYGFDDGTGITSGAVSFASETHQYTLVGSKRMYYSKNLPLKILYTDYNGEFCVGTAKFNDFISHSYETVGDGAVLRFLGYEGLPEIRLAVICGARNFHKWDYSSAIAEKGGKTLDKDGNICDIVKLTFKDGSREVTVSPELSALLPEVSYIQYSASVKFGDDEIFLPNGKNSVLADLTGDAATLQTGTVKEVFSNAIILDDDNGYCMSPLEFFACEVSVNGGGRKVFTQISADELEAGENVQYYLLNGAISLIIVDRR